MDEKEYDLSKIDLVIVDLYPFQKTVESTDDESDIIEKIDIGGVSLIRAAAKNFSDVTIISSKKQYKDFLDYLLKNEFKTDLNFRKGLAFEAFSVISEYDIHIQEFFGKSTGVYKKLRYGENPHQAAFFNGDIEDVFDKLNGKELSYNNLLDIDAGIRLISEFSLTTFAILKHNNACGISSSSNVTTSYLNAFEADPLSAFGGVLITNKKIDVNAAEKMNSLFFEIIISPGYTDEALSILKSKKNRIILLQKKEVHKKFTVKSILNGSLKQESDNIKNISKNWKVVTKIKSEKNQLNIPKSNVSREDLNRLCGRASSHTLHTYVHTSACTVFQWFCIVVHVCNVWDQYVHTCMNTFKYTTTCQKISKQPKTHWHSQHCKCALSVTVGGHGVMGGSTIESPCPVRVINRPFSMMVHTT